MRCDQVKRRLSAYLDGELTATAAEETAAHLRHCRSCKVEAERLQRAYEEIANGVDLAPDPFFITRLRAEMSARSRSTLQSHRGRRLQRAVLPITVAVGLFVGAQLGIRLGQNWYGTTLSSEASLESQLLSDLQLNSLTADYLALNDWKEAQDEE